MSSKKNLGRDEFFVAEPWEPLWIEKKEVGIGSRGKKMLKLERLEESDKKKKGERKKRQ